MKRARKYIIILTVAVIACCLISASLYSMALFRITFENAENLSGQRFALCDNELKFTGVSKNSVVVDSVSENPREESFTFEKEIAAASFCDGGFCGISYGNIEDGLYFYDFYFQSFDKSCSNHINLCFEFAVNGLNFAIDNDYNLYVFRLTDGFRILKFSKNGQFLKEIPLEEEAEQLMLINGKMHCVCNGTLYILEDDTPCMIYTDDFITIPCQMTGKNTLSDYEGKVFLLNGDNAELCADFNNAEALCCITQKYYLSGFENSLYGNSVSNPEISAYYDFDFDIMCLYYLEPYLYAGGYNEVEFEVIRLNDDDIHFIEPETVPPTQPETKIPSSEVTADPETETNPNSAKQTTPGTTAQTTAEPASQPITDPPAQPGTQTTTQKANQPTTQKVTQPAAQKVTEPATQKATQTTTQKATQPTTQKVTEQTATTAVPTTEKSGETQVPDVSADVPTTDNTDSTQCTAYESLKYSSDVYKFISGTQIVRGVEPTTTVSKFKKNFECNGEIKVYDKNNNPKTSGSVGTGMKAVFTKSTESAAYTVSVTGDLTGEGNVNTFDLTAMFNHLLGIADLQTIHIISGDLNNDGMITNKDLVLIKRTINASK